jgi:hypothetical protein
VRGGVTKNEGMKLFLWSCNAGCSLLVYGVRIVSVVQVSVQVLQHSKCFAFVASCVALPAVLTGCSMRFAVTACVRTEGTVQLPARNLGFVHLIVLLRKFCEYFRSSRTKWKVSCPRMTWRESEWQEAGVSRVQIAALSVDPHHGVSVCTEGTIRRPPTGALEVSHGQCTPPLPCGLYQPAQRACPQPGLTPQHLCDQN